MSIEYEENIRKNKEAQDKLKKIVSESKIIFEEVVNYDVTKLDLPMNGKKYDYDNPPKDYETSLSKMLFFAKFLGMEISKGCEASKNDVIFRTTSLKLVLECLLENVFIESETLFGVVEDTKLSMYLKTHGTYSILKTINTMALNKQKAIMDNKDNKDMNSYIK